MAIKKVVEKAVSEVLEEELVPRAINELKAVFDNEKTVTDLTRGAFKVLGDYGKILGAENQKRALDFAIARRTGKLVEGRATALI